MRANAPNTRRIPAILASALLACAALSACGGDSKESSPGGSPVPATDAAVADTGAGGTGAGGTVADAANPPPDANSGGGVIADGSSPPPDGSAGGVIADGSATPPDGGAGGVIADAAALLPDAFDPAACLGPDDCWSCAPREQSHFLNHCTTSDCAPFDNAARLPLLSDPLPPLP